MGSKAVNHHLVGVGLGAFSLWCQQMSIFIFLQCYTRLYIICYILDFMRPCCVSACCLFMAAAGTCQEQMLEFDNPLENVIDADNKATDCLQWLARICLGK